MIRYLRPGLERAHEVDLDRAEDVEADREPLEAEEERHQVGRLDEEGHARPGRDQKGVVLADVVLAHAGRVRDEHGEQARAHDEDLRERGVAVAVDRVCDLQAAVRGLDVDESRERRSDDEAERAEERGEGPQDPARHERAREQADRGGAERGQRGRDREPVDGRGVDHLFTSDVTKSIRPSGGWSFGRDRTNPVEEVVPKSGVFSSTTRPLIAAGQADSASRQATRGTTIPSSAGRRSTRRLGDGRAGLLVEDGRDQPEHVHRGEDDPRCAGHGPAPAGAEDAGEDQELTGERRGARHREGDDPRRHEHRRECRPSACHAAEPLETARWTSGAR